MKCLKPYSKNIENELNVYLSKGVLTSNLEIQTFQSALEFKYLSKDPKATTCALERKKQTLECLLNKNKDLKFKIFVQSYLKQYFN